MKCIALKGFILLLLFTAGFLVSWHHFYILSLHESPMQSIHTTLNEVPAWQGYWLYTELRHPLYAWIVFLLTFGGTFLTKRGLFLLAPVCVTVQGVSFGAFEYVLQTRYPGTTFFCITVVVGLFLGVLLVYWFLSAQTDNPLTLYAVGVSVGILFSYLISAWGRSLGVKVPFLHELPMNWGGGALVFYAVGCGILLNTLVNIKEAIETGAPKWAEWRAAMILFGYFLMLLKLCRFILLRRLQGQLTWERLNDAFKVISQAGSNDR
ncbi:MAG TPA: Bax inhibitor-1/YccA family protein [Verrucomicrobiae bacterium]|nr:Bax inhibitor-1/YccA family protein [Verrucomicrobiae bacterium]